MLVASDRRDQGPIPVGGLVMGILVDCQWAGGVLTVAVAGEVDFVTVDRVEAAVTTALSGNPRPERLIFDLAGVTFLDCFAIGRLLRCRRHAVEAGTRFAVRNPRGIVAQVLSLAGVLALLSDTGERRSGSELP